MGKATAEVLPALVKEAEANLPLHVPYDPWGRRVDKIQTSAAWDAFKAFSAQHGIVAVGYDPSFGEHRRVVQAALLHLYSATSAVFSCPLAMTDAAARVLLDIAPPDVRERLSSRLLSRNPDTFITSGQWMTERTGGSDVSRTETIARKIDGKRYRLYGTKFFTSATTSEMSLALARIEEGGATVEGSRGLTLFAVDVNRDAHGALEGIRINRLKDKLGTRALPTAELTLDGVEAIQIGEVGRGVANIAGMLNITRYYNTIASTSLMHKAHALARAFAWKREAFGAPIASHPLHAAMLDLLEAEAAGALALGLEVAMLLGKNDANTATADDKKRLRALLPIAKLTTGKQAVWACSEAVECFGGAGYMEDTGLPLLLRDAQVLPIWEGTTNVLALDVLRAEAKDGAFSSLLQHLGGRLEALPKALPAKELQLVRDTFSQLLSAVKAASAQGAAAVEGTARKAALTTGHLFEAMLLAETGANDAEGAERFARFARHRFGGPLG
jgi:alkylation response protein AidB-like acyl-CoA dehydrogenase